MLDSEKCAGCGACADICPNSAVSMAPDAEGFLYPKINFEKCTNCGVCEKHCIAVETFSASRPIGAFCCYSLNEESRLKSSSGGIFYLLAKNVIEKGGVVFGAAFDDNWQVSHTYTQTLGGLPKMQGSKYVQSQTAGAYRTAKKFLDSGKLVYFSGTPCQIAGLKAYVGAGYDNLFCQDILCHGVPSPMLWEGYVSLRSNIAGSPPWRIAFRAKPWKRFSVLFSYENNTEYRCVFSDDIYMRLFLNNIALRKSCYQCPAKGHSGSDITLGDYWGVENAHPEMDDDKGTSIVICGSDKGLAAFNAIKNDLKYLSTEMPARGMYWDSVKRPAKRSAFFNMYKEARDFPSKHKILTQFAKEPVSARIKKSLKRSPPYAIIKRLIKNNIPTGKNFYRP